MKPVIVALATGAIASLSLVAAPAVSAAEAYVTKAEFHAVSKGMNKDRVHRIFDVAGKQTWFYSGSSYCSWKDLWACPEQSREYRTKSKWGAVNVDYRRNPDGNWVVTSKYAYWG